MATLPQLTGEVRAAVSALSMAANVLRSLLTTSLETHPAREAILARHKDSIDDATVVIDAWSMELHSIANLLDLDLPDEPSEFNPDQARQFMAFLEMKAASIKLRGYC